MPARADIVFGHVQGNKYKKALDWYSHDFSQYKPYIIENERNNKQLFCQVTKTVLNKIPAEVLKHMNGKKFLRYRIAE